MHNFLFQYNMISASNSLKFNLSPHPYRCRSNNQNKYRMLL